MDTKFQYNESGNITSPTGFLAGAIKSGIKHPNKFDLAILYSEIPCVVAGVFTTNVIKAAPVVISKKHVQKGKVQAVIVNSGCANACTGDKGLANAVKETELVATKMNISPGEVLVASTGVIGVHLPMLKISSSIKKINLSRDGGAEFTQAIMTTDTFKKQIAITVQDKSGKFTIGGVAKGAGMIHPNMATMLCFITTDACIDRGCLQGILKKAVDLTFNMITVDGDTSPSDTVVVLANGLAKNELIQQKSSVLFQKALVEVCKYLAKCIARDGEGATKLIEVEIQGAVNKKEAKIAVLTVAGSSLVKSAIHGNDPNWGRIVAALGRCGIYIEERKIDVYLNTICVMKHGSPVDFDKVKLSRNLADHKEILIEVNLNVGKGNAVGWGCDLSEEYVTINSAYTT